MSPAGTADQVPLGPRALAAWHLAFYIIIVIQIGLILVTTEAGTGRFIQLGAVAVVVLAYAAFGHRYLLTDGEPLAHTYLVIIISMTLLASLQGFSALMLLVAAYSHIWTMAGSFRTGLWYALALGLGSMGVVWWLARDMPASEIMAQVAQMGIWLVFAIGMGRWTHNIITQSVERAALIEQLQAAQAELASAHHEAGVTAERERIAREIHDTLAQGFTSIVMLAQAAKAGAHTDPVQAERLDLIESTARDNLAEARALVRAFSPVALEGTSITEALERLATSFARETGIEVTAAIDAAPDLDRAREIVVLRAAQEALANIRKHAGASSVTLSLRSDGGGTQLRVRDDGVGIGSGVPGFGLRNLTERVREVGGSVTVGEPVSANLDDAESRRSASIGGGRGTEVFVHLPLVNPEMTDQ